MLKLRTILLQDKLYYLIFLLVVLITIVNVSIPRSSVYNSNMTEVTGKIISITIEGNKLKLILKNKGLIITEYIIGTPPDRINFPARNRIISGLADGIVVVEAKEKSGSLITADFGIEHGKDIFAVPGNINNANSIGTNNLIKQGANVATNYEDIINVCYS